MFLYPSINDNIENIKSLSMVGLLTDYKLNIFQHDEQKYVVINKYVFKLETFISLIIFYDTMQQCRWQDFSYLYDAGVELQNILLNQWRSIITEDDIFGVRYNYLSQKEKVGKFYKLIEELLSKVEIPEQITLANKSDTNISILEYIDYLLENPT